jgi:hypothetical protein
VYRLHLIAGVVDKKYEISTNNMFLQSIAGGQRYFGLEQPESRRPQQVGRKASRHQNFQITIISSVMIKKASIPIHRQ